jgi:TolB-like protein
VVERENSGRCAGAAAIHAVAVLPFVNTSGSPDEDYFSDGLTDELAHALTRVPGPRFAGRTSSYAFKGESVAAAEMGKALGVGAIVEGTVRRSGDRTRFPVKV